MSKVAVWLVPDLIKGSGGHRTILHHAYKMKLEGWRIVLNLESVTEKRSETPAELIRRLFGFDFEDVRLGWNEFEIADAYFATIWYSAKVVRDIPAQESSKYYFVQDYEACFNPMGDAYIAAENSYRYGLKAITIGRWLSVELKEKFSADTGYFDFCADRDIYKPLQDVIRESRSICFVYQPEKPRRCVALGIEALQIVKHHCPDVKIYLYGSTAKKPKGLDCESLGLLSLEQCNELYNRAAIGLCLSSSNPSRVPFEMMASGLPVVDLWMKNNIYDLPEDGSLLCDPTPESIAKGILELLASDGRRNTMSVAGLEFMKERDIELGLNQFINHLEQREGLQASDDIVTEPSYKKAPVIDDHFQLSRGVGSIYSSLGWKLLLKKYLPPVCIRILKTGHRYIKREVY